MEDGETLVLPELPDGVNSPPEQEVTCVAVHESVEEDPFTIDVGEALKVTEGADVVYGKIAKCCCPVVSPVVSVSIEENTGPGRLFTNRAKLPEGVKVTLVPTEAFAGKSVCFAAGLAWSYQPRKS